MTRTVVQTPQAPKAIGPYSQAIALNNSFVFCSGQIPLDPESMILEKPDIALQTRRVLKNLKAVLTASGSSPSKILKTTVFMTDLGQFETFNKEYGQFFETEAPGIAAPARSTVQVSALPKGALVEIEAIASI